MTFNLNYMQEKTNEFWDAYFKLLEIRDECRRKKCDEVPLVTEVDINEEYSLIFGRTLTRWSLVYKPMKCSVKEVNELDDATRASKLIEAYTNHCV